MRKREFLQIRKKFSLTTKDVVFKKDFNYSKAEDAYIVIIKTDKAEEIKKELVKEIKNITKTEYVITY